MVSAQFITQAAFTVGLPFLPLFIQDLGVRDPQQAALWAGTSATLSGVAMAVMAPIWGRLADLHGRKAMVLRATFAGAVVVGAMGLAAGPVALLVLRFVQGLVTGTVSASNTLVAATVPPERFGTSMGFMHTAVFAGAASGPLLGGVVADAFGYRVPFAVTAVLLLLAGLLVLLGARERHVKPPAGQPGHANRTKALWVALVPVVVVVFLDQFAGSVVVPVLPLVIAELSGEQGGVATMTGLVVGAFAVSASTGALLIGRLADRYSARDVLAVAAGGAAVLAFLQGFAWSPLSLGGLRVLMGFFVGGTIPAVNAVLNSLIRPEDRGIAFGITASAASFGFAVGPLIGALSVGVGFRAPFFLTALLLAAQCAWVLRSLPRAPRKEQRARS